MNNTNIYLTENKSDDYNNCLTELVETTEELSKEYYNKLKVDTNDVPILKKYFDLVLYEEESKRTSCDRFYGAGQY